MEPITPFIERIRELYEEEGISTVIVAGSSGAYFHIADCIVQMDRYMQKDITQTAKKEAEQFPQLSGPKEKAKKPDFARKPQQGREWKGNDRIKMKTLGKEEISINRETIDLRYVEQITDRTGNCSRILCQICAASFTGWNTYLAGSRGNAGRED